MNWPGESCSIWHNFPIVFFIFNLIFWYSNGLFLCFGGFGNGMSPRTQGHLRIGVRLNIGWNFNLLGSSFSVRPGLLSSFSSEALGGDGPGQTPYFFTDESWRNKPFTSLNLASVPPDLAQISWESGHSIEWSKDNESSNEMVSDLKCRSFGPLGSLWPWKRENQVSVALTAPYLPSVEAKSHGVRNWRKVLVHPETGICTLLEG